MTPSERRLVRETGKVLLMRTDGRIMLAGKLRFHLIRQGIAVDDISCKLNVVVCELSNLGVVHTKDLGFLVCAYAEAGNEVHDKEDQACTAEGVGGA